MLRNVCALVQAVMAHAEALVDAGVNPADIGIITPYNAQASLYPVRQ